MRDIRKDYLNIVQRVFDAIMTEQAQALDAAREAVVGALAGDRLVYVAGSGHSHMLAEEVFYRAGGIAAAQAILEPELMLHEGAERSTRLERETGRAAKVLARYPVGAGDVVFVASNSGRNAFPIELAQLAKARGATTVALTSLQHAREVTSRHASGQLLHQIADIVIDNCGAHGDAALTVDAAGTRMGPTSSLAGIFILNAILAEAVGQLAERGIEIDVYKSANMSGAEQATAAIMARWKNRIVGL